MDGVLAIALIASVLGFLGFMAGRFGEDTRDAFRDPHERRRE